MKGHTSFPAGKVSQQDEWIPTICSICRSFCSIKAHVVNGVVVSVEGNPESPANLGKMCAKGKAQIMSLYDPNRPLVPLKRTNPEKGIGVDPKWVEITWEEALNTITEKLKRIRQEDPRKLMLVSFDRAALSGVPSAFAAAFGTVNNSWGGYFCGNALHPSTYLTVGTHQQEVDLDYCNYLILFGNQLGFCGGQNPMSLTIKMGDALARGMKLVVVDPAGSHAAMKATEWVPIRPGTDGALAMGMLNILLNELGIYDADFLKRQSNAPYLTGSDGFFLRDASGKPLVWDVRGKEARPYDAGIPDVAIEGTYTVQGKVARPAFHLLKEHLKTYTLDRVSEITTVNPDTIHRLAQEYGEAAKIGSKITLDGVELPYRPAAALYFRGAVGHKHGTLASLAFQVLNTVVGNKFMVGGYRALNLVGPGWNPNLDPEEFRQAHETHVNCMPPVPWGPIQHSDGYIMSSKALTHRFPYPREELTPPDDLGLRDLYPLGLNLSPQVQITMMDPKKYGLPYEPEMLMVCRNNIMMAKGEPQGMAATLKRLSFIVTFSSEMDEVAEFADIVLPAAHQLERLDPFAQYTMGGLAAATGYWYWGIRQPVVKAPGQVRHWLEVLLDLAHRTNFGEEMNRMLNVYFGLKAPYGLDPSGKYNYQEIGDRMAKNMFGPDHDLAWFKKNGLLKFKRTVYEAYPGPFITGRHLVYFEYFPELGNKVKALTDELKLDWDFSDYQPFPDWKPCPSFEKNSTEYDLIAVNYKLPTHAFSFTAENPWLDEISEHHPYAYKVLIAPEAARRKRLRDGDVVWVESKAGRTKGELKITETIHPEVVGIPGMFGSWAKGKPIALGKGPHFNSLIGISPELIDPLSSSADCCVRVKVYKAT